LAVGALATTPYFDGFFGERLPNPTFGSKGILWSALTLALLTLPVVIVATEEAIAAAPRSLREASYGCGASKWQTVRRVVLPRAMPGVMTGMILAMARGAGEVAPLMLVGAVKQAPELPITSEWPFLHLERSFMHLGFHIYDLAFQSPDSEAARPAVWTTTLLLVVIIVALNMTAIGLRARLRRRFLTGAF
jgi:ABC-type phosphate transport system permease subunit